MVSAADKTFTVAVRGKEICQNWVFVTNYYVQRLDRSVERLVIVGRRERVALARSGSQERFVLKIPEQKAS